MPYVKCIMCTYLRDRHYSFQGFTHAYFLKWFELDSLNCRHITSSVKLLHELLDNHIDCPELLNKIDIPVPRISICTRISFYPPKVCTKIVKKSPTVISKKFRAGWANQKQWEYVFHVNVICPKFFGNDGMYVISTNFNRFANGCHIHILWQCKMHKW